MAVTFSFSAALPLTVVDPSSGAAQTLPVGIAPGRTPGELALALTSAQISTITADGGTVYIQQADIAQAAAVLGQLAALIAGAKPNG